MKEVTVDTNALREMIAQNRDRHRTHFEAAITGWERSVIQQLTRAVEAARAGTNYQTFFNLPKPEDHTDDYDDVIGMLTMHTEPTVVLTTREYRQYVTDDWDWKDNFVRTASSYTVT